MNSSDGAPMWNACGKRCGLVDCGTAAEWSSALWATKRDTRPSWWLASRRPIARPMPSPKLPPLDGGRASACSSLAADRLVLIFRRRCINVDEPPPDATRSPPLAALLAAASVSRPRVVRERGGCDAEVGAASLRLRAARLRRECRASSLSLLLRLTSGSLARPLDMHAES